MTVRFTLRRWTWDGNKVRSAEPEVRYTNRKVPNERGVALIIVLLVTALLIALIFEFAYGTRISLRAAINFRDSQRAYYLARSGVNFAGRYLAYNLQKDPVTGATHEYDNLEERDWQTVPYIPGNDTELRVRWEDETGKINISNATKGSDAYNRLVILFTNLGISQNILDQISEWMIEEKRSFYLLSDIHQFLNDEDFRKVQDYVTVLPPSVTPGNKIDINTASAAVLVSLGMSGNAAQTIVERRTEQLFKPTDDLSTYIGQNSAAIAGQLSFTSNVFSVNSYATVGGYLKKADAIITRTSDGSGFTILYWRAL
jgi:general secretion pathway protein K